MSTGILDPKTGSSDLPPRRPTPTPETVPAKPSFAETALRLGGKSVGEAQRTGAMDLADEQVDTLFKYSTVGSPIHRAVWERQLPVDLFQAKRTTVDATVRSVMDKSLAVVRRHRQNGTLLDDQKKISDTVLSELGTAGYWGLLVDREYGGSEAPFAHFAPFLTEMAMLDPTIAGLASVHGCIGAVDPLQAFGNAEQKARFLPSLASGARLSGFALTEPGAGSDLSALRTTATRQGDEYVINGEKLFITNVRPGRTVGLVCLIDGRPQVLVVDLPREESAEFRFKKYGLYALKHTHNQGMIFNGLRVPAENLLDPGHGDGLTIAYHGLNRGRVSLCANAAGTMRLMMANMIPWAKFRKTYGQAIVNRELVQRRLGQLAGMIVGCDALTEWCAWLLDEGYRGEMECIIAKIFGSEAQKDAAIELFMKTHGGRSFLHGHLFGDNVHEFLAPCIYEGEGEMLGMAFFKSLVKQHGTLFFQPIGEALHAAGVKQPNLANPYHLWLLRKPLATYAGWFGNRLAWGAERPTMPAMPENLRDHAAFAADFLQRSSLDISKTMRTYQLKLADRQCRMAELSHRVQTAAVILATTFHAARQENEIIRESAWVLAERLRNQLTGRRPTDNYFRRVTKLGDAISDGQFPGLDAAAVDEILMPYTP